MALAHVCACGGIIPITRGRPPSKCKSCLATSRLPASARRQIADAEVSDSPGTVETATRETLHAAGVSGTPKYEIAVKLARALDTGWGASASGSAALARELRASIDDALSEAKGAGDALSELLDARRARRDA